MSRRERLKKILELGENKTDALELEREKTRHGEITNLAFASGEKKRHKQILMQRLRDMRKEEPYASLCRRRKNSLMNYIRRYGVRRWPKLLAWATRRTRWYGRTYASDRDTNFSYWDQTSRMLTGDLLDLHARGLIRCRRMAVPDNRRRYRYPWRRRRRPKTPPACRSCERRSKALPEIQIPTLLRLGRPVTSMFYENGVLIYRLMSVDPSFYTEHSTKPSRLLRRISKGINRMRSKKDCKGKRELRMRSRL